MSALSTLQYYLERVHRLIEEALEVSLVLCNTELREFTIAKIFDIFNQIFPTAFVLGTSYWPYYYTLQKQKLCICARYGIICRHLRTRHQNHFIDMDPVVPDESLMFCVKKGVSVIPSQYFIDVVPLMTEGVSGYSISMKFTLKYQQNTARGLKRVKTDETFNIPESVFPVSIFCRYNFQGEYYPNIHTIRFEPNPLYFENYGSIFQRLISIRPHVHSLFRDHPQFLQIHVQDIPEFTLILQHVVNLPLFINYSKIMAIPAKLSHQISYRRPVVHRGTQTSSNEELQTCPTTKGTADIKIEKLSDDNDDDAQEMSISTTTYIRNNSRVDHVVDEQCGDDSDALAVETVPEPLSPFDGSLDIRNNTTDSQETIDSERLIKTENELIHLVENKNSKNSGEFKLRWPDNQGTTSSTRLMHNWAYKKSDIIKNQDSVKSFHNYAKDTDEDEIWSDSGFQKLSSNRNYKRSTITTNAESYSPSASSANNSLTFSSGTSYASNRIYKTYAQIAKRSKCPATMATMSSSVDEQDKLNSPDSTSCSDFIKLEKEGISNEPGSDPVSAIEKWMSSKATIDYVPVTIDEINQQFDDMEEIIRDDMDKKIKKEIVD